jgi:hypothetical protein
MRLDAGARRIGRERRARVPRRRDRNFADAELFCERDRERDAAVFE